jgi:DNA-binding Lrp family transcriptional regulator
MTGHPRRGRAALTGSARREGALQLACPECPVEAMVHVRLGPTASRPDFERYLRTIPAVQFAWQVAGDVDYELRIACPDIAGLYAVLTGLRRCGGAEGTSTGLVLRQVPGLGELGSSGSAGPSDALAAEWRIP